MALIQVRELTFGYDGSADTIFDQVSFQLDTDWKLGFVGRNGRGKTTFLRLLQGMYEYRGKILAPPDVVYFPFPVERSDQDTCIVVGDIAPGIALWQIQREFSLLDMAEEILYRPFSTLSNGEQTKVLLAALFLRDNPFLLIDEPTNHLDMAGRETVSRYLNGKKGFILVSHDRAFLDGCVDHILSINRKDIIVQKGNFSSWQENMDRQEAFELAENQKLAREVKRLEAVARQTSSWSDAVEKTKFGQRLSGSKPDKGYIGHKSAKMMKRAKVTEQRREKAVVQKAELLKNVEGKEELFMRPLAYHKQRLASVADLCLAYGGREICAGVNFTVEAGERIALLGKNGSGKSSILKLLVGGETPGLQSTGTIETGSRLVISYVAQDTGFLRGNLRQWAQAQDVDESLFKTLLRKLDFTRSQFDKDMAEYSGGQKKKVLLATSLSQAAHLYIWDEPLNYIDVISRLQIEELILSYGPTMIFVEHDRQFTDEVATKKILL